MKKRLIKISVLLLEAVLLYVVLNFNIGCFFRNNFNIRCPGCGLTRAFMSILKLNFISAIKYNIISVPLFIIIIFINILLIYDFIFNENKAEKFIKRIFSAHFLIIIILVITAVINNVNKV